MITTTMARAKVLVTGANGQLGSALSKYKENISMDIDFVTRVQLDLSNSTSIHSFFAKRHYDLIINCAAYTSVDKAEEEIDLAYQINATAVETLAQISKIHDTMLIHISTDYVFDGQNHKPYTETDEVNPLGIYGKSKLLGEQAIQSIAPQSIIIRTSWLYGLIGHNFFKTMYKLGQEKDSLRIVYDQIGTPTLVDDLAIAIYKLLNHENLQGKVAEIYHFSNEGVASWYDFAQAIFNLDHINCIIDPIQSQEYPTLAERPHYSVLNKAKIKNDFDIKISHWQNTLKDLLVS